MRSEILSLLLIAAPLAQAQTTNNPVADEAAVVVYDQARFTVLTSGVIRCEWDSAGKFEDRASMTFINRKLPVPAFTHKVDKNGN